MKRDIEIAQAAVMEPIANVVAPYGVTADDIEQYGKYKAKLSEELLASLSEKPDGKLVLVTAINPTPAGEGKTTTSIGLGQAFGKLGKKAIVDADMHLGEGSGAVAALTLLQMAINVYNSGHSFGDIGIEAYKPQ